MKKRQLILLLLAAAALLTSCGTETSAETDSAQDTSVSQTERAHDCCGGAAETDSTDTKPDCCGQEVTPAEQIPDCCGG